MDKAKKLWAYLVLRFQEASAWRAIFILAGGSAALMDPEKAEAYMTLAMIFSGAIGILMPDDVSKQGIAEAKAEAAVKAATPDQPGKGEVVDTDKK